MNQTQSNEAAQEATALRHVQLAADWYYFIVAVTIAVLLIVGFTGRSVPAFGLFTPVMLVGGVPQNLAASLLLLVLMAAILLAFVAIGIKAGEASYDACRLGFALYLVDSVLMLLTFNPSTGPFQRYGGLLFHIFGLVGLGNGMVAISHLERLRHLRLMREAAPRPHPTPPATPLPALPEAGGVGSVAGAPGADPGTGGVGESIDTPSASEGAGGRIGEAGRGSEGAEGSI